MKYLKAKQMEIKNGHKGVAIHCVKFPEYHDKGWYRMMISFSAFFESLKMRNQSKKYLYHLIEERDQDIHSKLLEFDKELPRVKHESLYEFFDYIGYDRKRKKIYDKH